MSTVYYSPLSTLVPREAFPEALGFVKDGLVSLLDDVYFRDLQHSESIRGDAAQYSLTIVSQTALEIEVPGTGIFLVLNPDLDASVPDATSAFDVTLRYDWPVLAWIRGFDLETFSWQPGDFYQLILTVLGVTERQVLERAIEVFTGGSVPGFISAYNDFYDPDISVPSGDIGDVQAAIETEQGKGASLVIFAMYIVDTADLAKSEERLDQLFGTFFGGSVKDWFTRQIAPRIEATLDISAGIRFPRNILIPLDEVTGEPKDGFSFLTFDPGSFRFSTESGIGYEEELTADFTRSQIGNTGFEIDFDHAKLDLSRTTNIPEATADGRPEDFVGVFIDSATIKLPKFFNTNSGTSTAQLVGRKLLIGTGGLSGTIGLEAVDPNDPTPALIRGKFGSGFEIGLSAVSMTFQQNAITASSIKGYMVIPGFEDTEGNPAEIQIDVSIGSDGSFSVTASEEQGIEALRIPNVVDIEIKSVSVGREKDRFFVALSGALDFHPIPPLGEYIPDKIEIQKLKIWDDGKIELEGGSIVLPSAATLQVGPVGIAITAIHFGTLEQEFEGKLRKYAFFGFDGGLSIDPGGVDARGDGIKLYFTTDNDPDPDPALDKPFDIFLRITSIAIDIVIPGSATPETAAVILSGYLSMKDDGQGSTEYIGGVAVSLPKLSIAGSAAMRYNPRLPSFIIDLGLEISTPIVLGSTGLGIYGFRGLLGMRYVAKKTAVQGLTEESEWWQYYKAKVAPDLREGIQVSKFSAEEGFSAGAGISLATAPDAGVAFSSKIFFLLSLPEVFLLQGQAQILKQRIGLDTTQDPPFFALIAISSTSIETAFGVNYKIPDGGEIAKIDAVLEMGFFFGNAGAWYINLGRDQPEDRRVRAVLLTIFNSYYYLMLSSSGIRTGAGVSYALDKTIGPFRVELRAYMDMAGRISFKPLQVGGSIELGGHLGLSIFGVGFSISASAGLSGEAPRPFIITGRLKACVKILWSKKCVTVELTWTINPNPNFDAIELLPANGGNAVQAVNVLTLETYPLFASNALPSPAQLDAHIIPMDSYIDIEFRQPVNPAATASKFFALGGAPEFTADISPQKAKSPQVRHEFTLESVEIMSWDPIGSAWKPYDVYGAATPLQLAPWIVTDLTKLAHGYWQDMHPTKHTKLRVLAQTPFSYQRDGVPYTPPEDLGVGVEDVFCAPEKREMQCRDFEQPLKQQSTNIVPGKWYSMPNVLYRVGEPGATIGHSPWKDKQNALCIDQDNSITLLFPEETARATLLLRTEAETAEVTWYRRNPVPHPAGGQAPWYEWEAVRTDSIASSKLTEYVRYDDLTRPILRVDIRGGRCIRKPRGGVDNRTLAAVERFFNELARRGDLAGRAVTLYPEPGRHSPLDRLIDRFLGRVIPPDGVLALRQHKYFDAFLDSVLYRLLPETRFTRYEAEATPLLLRAKVTDSRDFRCDYQLWPQDGVTAIDWSKVREVSGLRVVEGETHGFSGRLAFDRGEITNILGRSCHVVQTPPAGEVPVHCEDAKDIAEALLRFLEALRANQHLLAPSLNFYPGLYDVYRDRFFHGPLYDIERTKAKRLLYTTAWDPDGGPLFIRIRDFHDYDCLIRLDVQNRELFGKIQRFVRVEPDHATGDGPVYDFILTVIIEGREATIRGTSCYPLRECHRGCRTCLYEVCYETVEDAIYNENIPSDGQVEDEANAMVEALSGSIQPIWRPDTYFAMRVVVNDTARNKETNGIGSNQDTTLVIGWRTAGPVGHYHRYLDAGHAPTPHPEYQKLLDEKREDEFKLATLQHYLDFPRCYPNADGRLTNAKPLFYVAPRLDLFYVKPYVYEMYRDWDAYNNAEKIFSALELEIIDPAPPPAAPPAPVVAASWEVTPSIAQAVEVAIIDGFLTNGDPCGDVPPPGDGIDVVTEFTVPQLEPLKLYTAVFRNALRRQSASLPSRQEVHRYVFQTSRYPDFAAQIGSWAHETDKNGVLVRAAIYEVEVAPDAAALAAAAAVLADPATSSDDLKQRFADPFDRLMDGILELEPLPPVVTTEFNLIRLAGDTRVLGILVRNPEPFNDPKMPAGELATTVRLSVDGGSTAAYRGLHAKDAARVFVTNAAHTMAMPEGTYKLTFDYRRWNGTMYVNESTGSAEFARP